MNLETWVRQLKSLSVLMPQDAEIRTAVAPHATDTQTVL